MVEGLTQLSEGQLSLLLAALTLAGAVVGYFGRGAAFLAHRWWTGAGVQERATLYTTLVDLRSKMGAAGLSMREVRDLAALIESDGIAGSSAAEALIGEGPEKAQEEPRAYWSNYAMSARAFARLGVVEAELEAAVMDLRLHLADGEEEFLDQAHRAWCAFRDSEINRAGARYLGGTHQGLAGTLHGISLTERRIAELRDEIADRQSV